MIVRIMGRGQVEVDDAEVAGLDTLDDTLMAAVAAGDEPGFRASLIALVDRVCAVGTPVADDALLPSDIVLPSPDAELAEVRGLIDDEGLIPG